jgi:hypothetical protein
MEIKGLKIIIADFQTPWQTLLVICPTFILPEWMGKGSDGWIDGWMMNKLVGKWMDKKQLDRGRDRWMDGWMGK